MDKGLYTIGEVAKLTGVPVKTIRYYADIGLLPPAATASSRYRFYAAAEVWRLELIRTLRRMDFGLDDIRRLLTGDMAVVTAIDLHLDALALQIAHLTRIRGLLERAKAHAADGDTSLDDLHALGLVVLHGDAERRRFLADAVRAMLVDVAAPESWQEHMVRGFVARLPADLSPDQEAALVELRSLMADPALVAATQEGMAGFWEGMRAHAVAPTWWDAGLTAIHDRARAAVERGATPDSPDVQGIVRDWVALFATATERPLTDAFVRRMAEQAPTWGAGASQRLTDVLLRLAPPDTQRVLPLVQRLLLDGLRCYAARLDEGTVDASPSSHA